MVEDPQSSQQVVPGSLLISLQSPLGGSEEAAATWTSLEWRNYCEQEQGMFGTLYNQHYTLEERSENLLLGKLSKEWLLLF